MALTNGLVVMTPTTVDKTGGSSTATINADGSVDFTSCATLSLNGVFTSAYDNYMVVCRHVPSTSVNIDMRLRSNGTDNSTASSYVRQYLGADGTTVAANRLTSDKWGAVFSSFTTQRNGATLYLFGPQLSQPTAFRSVTIESSNSAGLVDNCGTHNQSASYDGFTLICANASYSFTGLITVFGFNQ